MNQFVKLNNDTKFQALVEYNFMHSDDRETVQDGIRMLNDTEIHQFLVVICQSIAAIRASTQITLDQSKSALMSFGYRTALKDYRHKFTDSEYKDALQSSPFVDKEF